MPFTSRSTSASALSVPHDPNGDFPERIQKSLRWWLPLSLAFFGTQVAWLLSEREPNNKELTFAYRMHVMDSLTDTERMSAANLHATLSGIQLIKRDCEMLKSETYRCRTLSTQKDHPLAGAHEANDAIYHRDPKGWRFSPLASL